MSDVTPLTLVSNRPIGTDPRSIAALLANFDHIVNEVNANIVPAINTVGEESFQDFLVPGVPQSTDCTLTRDSSSQVTISAGTVWASVAGVLRRYSVSTTVLSGIPAATNTRFDTIVFDTTDGLVKRLTGTDQVGVTLANRTGAPAIAATRQELWNLFVQTTGVGAVQNTDYGDRRLPVSPVIKGWIGAGGATSTGFGFRVASLGAGHYEVKYNRPTVRIPNVVVCAQGSYIASVVSDSMDVDGFESMVVTDAGVADNQRVNFIADYS